MECLHGLEAPLDRSAALKDCLKFDKRCNRYLEQIGYINKNHRELLAMSQRVSPLASIFTWHGLQGTLATTTREKGCSVLARRATDSRWTPNPWMRRILVTVPRKGIFPLQIYKDITKLDFIGNHVFVPGIGVFVHICVFFCCFCDSWNGRFCSASMQSLYPAWKEGMDRHFGLGVLVQWNHDLGDGLEWFGTPTGSLAEIGKCCLQQTNPGKIDQIWLELQQYDCF